MQDIKHKQEKQNKMLNRSTVGDGNVPKIKQRQGIIRLFKKSALKTVYQKGNAFNMFVRL